jgi:rhodanese-related sulfurtransferase
MTKGAWPPSFGDMHRRALIALIGLSPTLALAQGQRPTLSVREAHEQAKAGAITLIDIRTPEEWRDTGVPDGAMKLDMTSGTFVARLAGLRAENPNRPIALICRTASRSRHVQEELSRRGWQGLINVRGGMLGDGQNKGWLDENLPVTR